VTDFVKLPETALAMAVAAQAGNSLNRTSNYNNNPELPHLTVPAQTIPITRMLDVLIILAGYLFGSISSALVLCRVMGYPDPRSEGSGNPGATNILRLHGKLSALITLAGDLFKGLLPLLIARWLGAGDWSMAEMGLAAFLGHLYPIFFGFRGGKGVATFLGVLYGLAWPAGVIFMLTWGVVAALARYSSLAALIASAFSPAALFWLSGSWAYMWASLLMVALLYWRHRSNISKLMDGSEPQLGVKDEPGQTDQESD